MNRKMKLLGLALGVTALLALGLGGAVMAADDRDRGANCGNCLEGTLPEGAVCPRLDADGAELGACYRWGEDAERVCPNEDGVCTEEDCPCAGEGEATPAGNCWRGAQAEGYCLDETGENVAAFAGRGCMRGAR